MDALHQILSPDFLLRNSVYTSVLVGFACPLVGVFLVMRRLVFMGVALPQISSTGVAVALSLPLWLGFKLADHGSHSAHALAFAGSITFSLTAILALAFMERRGRGQPEGRLGAAYVVAAALGILLLSKNPYGEIGWLDMLKGEVIAISGFDLALTAATFMLVLTTLGLFHKELLLVSFDREMASILGKNVVFWDVLLYLLIGLTVSMAVLSVGPLIAFGFLLIPALTAHLMRAPCASSRRWPLWLVARPRSSASGSRIDGICPSVRRMSSSSACSTRRPGLPPNFSPEAHEDFARLELRRRFV